MARTILGLLATATLAATHRKQAIARFGQGGYNFPDQITQFSPAGRSGESLHLTERLTVVDAKTLRYEFTVDNPAIFTRSFAARFPMKRTESPIYEYAEYARHEGNYGLENILTAARAEDTR